MIPSRRTSAPKHLLVAGLLAAAASAAIFCGSAGAQPVRQELGYDAQGRAVSTTSGWGGTATYSLTPAGHHERVQWSDGSSSHVLIESAEYDTSSVLRTRTYGSDAASARATYEHDALGRLLASRLERGAETLHRVEGLRYGAEGQLLAYHRRDVLYPEPGVPVGAGYDPYGQLTTYTVGSDVSTYTYSDVGGPETRSAFSPEAASRPMALDARTVSYQPEHPFRVAGWRYSPGGRVLDDGRYRYEYDAQGRLRALLDAASGAVVEAYLYDADGLRARVAERDLVRETLRRGPAVSSERLRATDGGERVIEHVTFHGAAVAQITLEDGEARAEHLFTDRVGSDAVRWRGTEPPTLEAYSPFGLPLLGAPTASNANRFTGHELDATTGLTYMRSRYYHPELGSFLRLDPARDLDPTRPLFNLYRYVGNDPLSRIDPMGLAGEPPSVSRPRGFPLDLKSPVDRGYMSGPPRAPHKMDGQLKVAVIGASAPARAWTGSFYRSGGYLVVNGVTSLHQMVELLEQISAQERMPIGTLTIDGHGVRDVGAIVLLGGESSLHEQFSIEALEAYPEMAERLAGLLAEGSILNGASCFFGLDVQCMQPIADTLQTTVRGMQSIILVEGVALHLGFSGWQMVTVQPSDEGQRLRQDTPSEPGDRQN